MKYKTFKLNTYFFLFDKSVNTFFNHILMLAEFVVDEKKKTFSYSLIVQLHLYIRIYEFYIIYVYIFIIYTIIINVLYIQYMKLCIHFHFYIIHKRNDE